ncbi:pyridoxamine 5'-phosphate oxidase [Streptomyces bathyalis]|uniref:Pyridoxamine 5'-phosphate oxidase n=1 Tax=Streptomyces bathyalis TaxID=2710756 RepID=A0A7T1TD21_9ACTN|nr:pyridoxamine 5'-phosphate oxidase [Streptomyces bathyalis]
MQRRLGTSDRAERFYDEQVLDHLNDRMREFVQRQEMFFLATADASGECDSSFRAGPAGFLQVLGERTLAYPEYRGNGVNASLGNIQENPHLGIMLIDFTRARIGLHINGRARIVEDEELRALYPDLADDQVPGRRAQLWVHVEVEEAYIHCAKHIPQMQKAQRRTARDWGTDDYKRKGGDFFGTARDARERVALDEGGAREHARRAEPSARGKQEPEEGSGAVPSISVPAPSSSYSSPSPSSSSSEASSSTSSSSPYDELPGFAREEAHGDAASAAPSREAGNVLAVDADPRDSEVAEQRFSFRSRGVPEQRRSPDLESPDVTSPTAPSVSASASANSREQTGSTAMDGASGALAARGAPSPGFRMIGSDPHAWRQEAERALAEAQRRGAVSGPGSFQGWFG